MVRCLRTISYWVSIHLEAAKWTFCGRRSAVGGELAIEDLAPFVLTGSTAFLTEAVRRKSSFGKRLTAFPTSNLITDENTRMCARPRASRERRSVTTLKRYIRGKSIDKRGFFALVRPNPFLTLVRTSFRAPEAVGSFLVESHAPENFKITTGSGWWARSARNLVDIPTTRRRSVTSRRCCAPGPAVTAPSLAAKILSGVCRAPRHRAKWPDR